MLDPDALVDGLVEESPYLWPGQQVGGLNSVGQAEGEIQLLHGGLVIGCEFGLPLVCRDAGHEPEAITHGFGTPLATTETFTYDEDGNPLTIHDGNGHVTEYGYNAADDRTRQVDADGNETKWGYNSTHDVISTTTPKGETTTIKRDSHGNAEAIERPAPAGKTQITKYKYASNGDLESVTDPLARMTKYEYNSDGDRTVALDPADDRRTFGYDGDSQQTSTVSPRGNVEGGEPSKYTTKTERDAQERPIKVTDPLGHETKYAYDANGNVESITDALAHKTKYTYDADNEQTKTERPSGAISETGYDGAGQVTSQTDGNKHTTKYTRNVLEQVTEVEDPLKHKTINEYDAAGSLTAVTDPLRRKTAYVYDAANRLKEVTYSDGKTHSVATEYDADGERTKVVDGTGTTTLTYDQLDRLTESKDGHGNVVKYEYDLANEPTKITYPNAKAVTRAYDKAGRLEKVTDWSEHTTSFAYDSDSNQTKTTWPSGTSGEDKYAYNEADQQTEVKILKGAETLASLAYSRDADGQLKEVTSMGLPGEAKPAYEYDANNRLTKGAGIAYEYDPGDNPTKAGSSTNTFNAGNEIEKSGTSTYAFDEADERTKMTPSAGAATTYTYDQAGNLTAVERPKEGKTAAITDTYSYDGTGLRMSQTIAGTKSFFAWQTSEGLPLLLNDGTNSYIYGVGNVPIEQISGSGTVLYLHHDQQGSTRMLTSSTGKAEATFTYDAYGNTTGTTGTATTPLGYDAQLTASDTGLVYLRARVYDPKTGQFMSRDPLASQTHAAYNFAADNPVNGGDPSGLDTHGYCVSGGGTAGPATGFASVCVVKNDKNEIGIEFTLGGAGGITSNAISSIEALVEHPETLLHEFFSDSVSFGYQSSNATTVCELGGPFSYKTASAGLLVSGSVESFTNGEGVSGKTYSLGSGTGVSFTGGTSETVVVAFGQDSGVAKVFNPVLDSLNQANLLWQLGL